MDEVKECCGVPPRPVAAEPLARNRFAVRLELARERRLVDADRCEVLRVQALMAERRVRITLLEDELAAVDPDAAHGDAVRVEEVPDGE